MKLTAPTIMDTRAAHGGAALPQGVYTHMPTLDGLRGLAVLAVVWHNVAAGHYTGSAIARTVNLLANTGWLGVQLFFALSGFLITGILLDEKGAPRQLRNFYMRRVLRILPIYYGVLLLAFVVLPQLGLLPEWLRQDYDRRFWYGTFLVNWSAPFLGDGPAFGHFWSLAVEEQFYLLWPACVIFLRPRALLMACGVLMVSAPLARFVLSWYDPVFAVGAAYKFTFARWDALAVGAALALIVRRPHWYRTTLKTTAITLYGSLFYILLFALINKNYAPVAPGIGALNQSVAALLFGACLLLAIGSASSRSIVWQQFLLSPILRGVGRYSYAIYVFHLPMIHIVEPFWLSHFARFQSALPMTIATGFAALVFACSFVAAVFSWYLLEQPCLRLKRFFITSKTVAVV